MPNPPHTIPATTTHTHTIILLHGLGSSGPEFAAEFLESQASNGKTLLQIYPFIRWIFPTAPFKYAMPLGYSWFDIEDVTEPEKNEETQYAGLERSARILETVVDVESRLGGSKEVVLLGGISQGCATALHFLLEGKTRFGGLLGFCGWLPFARHKMCALDGANSTTDTDDSAVIRGGISDQGISHQVSGACLKTPMLLQHSEDDGVVPFENGLAMRLTLKRLGGRVIWKTFEEGGHWLVESKGIDTLVKFVDDVVAWKFL